MCPSWRRLASDPVFILDHHRRQPELPLISSSPTPDGTDGTASRLADVHLRGAKFRRWVFLLPELFEHGFRVDASCDGMIITGRSTYNPATRQLMPFDRPRGRLVGLFDEA
jgi:hypothetical protein